MSTLIDIVLTDMTSKSNIDATVANYVQSLADEVPHYRIADAYEDFIAQRIAASDQEKLTGVRGDDPVVAPEYMLTFTQRVMNMIMWKARRLKDSIAKQESFDSDTSGGTGQDFGNDLCEEFGIAPVDANGLAELVANDYASLQSIHSEIAKDCNSYLDNVAEFGYFVENAPDDDGVWHEIGRASDYDTAIDLVDGIAEKLRENESANRRARFRKAA